MEWNRRKSVIIYSTFLLVVFMLSGLFNTNNLVTEFNVVCDNGTVETFNYDDLYICGGYENPLRKNVIEVNFTLLIEKI